ncbi:serine hydrolase domain-containing protein [Microlunatus speluncae]|uniref:serine hydrolase domain-containing protein n=1 Tax=Microlunatus speluncae TaxID=2594267 RepID=UPI0012665F20|nr:serine hydrolase domain-containing protein [Microlunatus speluncae]
MTFDRDHWQRRFDTLRQAHHVPGAALAVLADGELHELAGGVLHRRTGVPVTPGAIFQSGSVAKVYTATMIMKLVDDGRLDLEARVVDVLPEFGTPDPEATKSITVRQLLSHTGGVTNDFNLDTGRGDDCLEKYVAAAREVSLDLPPGVTVSYGSLGYVVLGRLVEVITGTTWDQALKDLIFTPLGLRQSMSLPEEALAHPAAMSHLGEPGTDPDPAPHWDLIPRAFGPAARVLVSAGDLARLAKLHLDGGVAPDGRRLLGAETVAAMQRPEGKTKDKWTVGSDAWGLGWTLYDWTGARGFGHDGAAIGQYAYLRAFPDAGMVVALMTNGGGARQLYADLFRELFAELAGLSMPDPFEAPEPAPAVDLAPFLGTYRREGVDITISETDTGGRIRYAFTGTMAKLSPPIEGDLLPVAPDVFGATGAGPSFSEGLMPVVFSRINGDLYCFVGMRATPKVA